MEKYRIIETDRPHMTIWRLRISCLEPKATNIQSQYAILTFKNLASFISDGRTATLQMLHYIYIFFSKYKYRVFKTCCTLSIFLFKMPYIS
jgi:hypothetical protein